MVSFSDPIAKVAHGTVNRAGAVPSDAWMARTVAVLKHHALTMTG